MWAEALGLGACLYRQRHRQVGLDGNATRDRVAIGVGADDHQLQAEAPLQSVVAVLHLCDAYLTRAVLMLQHLNLGVSRRALTRPAAHTLGRVLAAVIDHYDCCACGCLQCACVAECQTDVLGAVLIRAGCDLRHCVHDDDVRAAGCGDGGGQLGHVLGQQEVRRHSQQANVNVFGVNLVMLEVRLEALAHALAALGGDDQHAALLAAIAAPLDTHRDGVG